MIISHKHKFIFIKTRKTAGTSIEFALRTICGPNDITTRTNLKGEEERKAFGFPPPQNDQAKFSTYRLKDWYTLLSKRKKTNLIHQHVSAQYVKSLVTKNQWDSYYKFAFERNPYDKVISYYHWLTQNKVTKMSFKNFLESEYLDRLHSNLYYIDDFIAVDKIYKYEDLDAAMKDISSKLGLEYPLKIPRLKAKSNTRIDKRHYSDVLTHEERLLIESKFHHEIKLLNYTFKIEVSAPDSTPT